MGSAERPRLTVTRSARHTVVQLIDDSVGRTVASASTLEEGLRTMADAVEAGVRGATIGRNIWGNENITAAMKAFNAVIHDRKSPREAIEANFSQKQPF